MRRLATLWGALLVGCSFGSEVPPPAPTPPPASATVAVAPPGATGAYAAGLQSPSFPADAGLGQAGAPPEPSSPEPDTEAQPGVAL